MAEFLLPLLVSSLSLCTVAIWSFKSFLNSNLSGQCEQSKPFSPVWNFLWFWGKKCIILHDHIYMNTYIVYTVQGKTINIKYKYIRIYKSNKLCYTNFISVIILYVYTVYNININFIWTLLDTSLSHWQAYIYHISLFLYCLLLVMCGCCWMCPYVCDVCHYILQLEMHVFFSSWKSCNLFF